jgi:uncharacterized protein (DUF885 family)
MTMRIDRREFLGATALTSVATALPAWGQMAMHTPNPELAALFDSIFREGLRRRPEGATQLGFDKGPNADLRGKLSDEGETGRAAAKAATTEEIHRLSAIDRARLDAVDQLNLDVVLYSARSAAAVQAFPFGGSAFGPTPYVISQNSGAYQSIPDFLDTKHPINDASDADAYLSRLTAFAGQLDAQTEKAKHDAGLGVLPPDFILDLTLDQMTKTAVPADQSLLVKSITRRAAAKGLDTHYAADAARIYTTSVLPALQRQVDQVRAMRAKATHDAGIWRFDHGAEFYEVALHNTTTTSLSPAEVHAFGLDQARMISARLDGLLKQQGMTKGTVGERMAALYKDPRQLYADTDAGKVDAIAYCNDRLAAIKGRLPSVFSRVPPYSFEVRRVPPQTEAGAASAFSQPPTLDGSRPGIVYFNLHDSTEWPKFCLATTIYHEGLPGHQLEGGLALSNKDLPLLRKTQGFSGYAEGWALYAEQLADEIGMYDDDPMGRLGYLKFQLFRANRCVVDTGIHHLHWSYEKAWQYLVAGEGEAEGFARREIERYCSSPGQACSYKLGHSAFVDLREKAKAKLGSRFDIKAYHDAVLGTGRVPLDILKAHGEAWIASV